MSSAPKKGFVNFLQEFSLPLIAGVFAALLFANVDSELYHKLIEFDLGFSILGHHVTPKFLIDDIFMVFFFGIAAKEITEAALPGGSLNPIKKAINPLLATAGGVLGPIAVYFGVIYLYSHGGGFDEAHDFKTVSHGWGIPTATDIALAWLVARAVFGPGHPAINYLLLLAVADDAVGLVIIAVFYGDGAVHPAALLWTVGGMALAFALRKAKVNRWEPYIFLAGPLAWFGLVEAHVHPALALVFIVPFLPGPKHDTGLFKEQDEVDLDLPGHAPAHSALHMFEHQLKLFVDLGLFFFAFANAGVELAGVGPLTWTILISLVVGKTVGITLFGWLGSKVGFMLPTGMGMKELVVAGFVAALGLTVALFVAAQAYKGHEELVGQAKMGALLSGFVGVAAIWLGRALKVRKN